MSGIGQRWLTIIYTAAVSILLFVPSARAQTVDYGGLEQLFNEPVTTSATGSPQRVTDVPANMEIITADEIRRSGATDVPGVLRHVLGVDVMEWSNNNADVGVRGYNQAFSPRLLVLVDGRQVYVDDNGYTPWSAVPVILSAIRQIEVVKGPSTALFGFNAVSGVINIITYNPIYDDVNTVALSGGTQGLAEGSIVKTFRARDRGALRLSAYGHVDDDYSTALPASTGTLPRKPQDRFAFDADGVIRVADHVQLRLEASHAGGGSNNIGPFYLLSNIYHYTSSAKVQLAADTRLGLIEATVYKNWVTQQGDLGFPVRLKITNEVTVAQLQDVFRIGSAHTLRLSAEYRHNTAGTTPFEGGQVFYNTVSAGAMWNWTLSPALALTNALRFDDVKLGRNGIVPLGYPFSNADWDRNLQEWSFNSGLVWKIRRADTVRLTVGRGVQLPDLANLGALVVSLPPFFNLTGIPTMQPSTVMNYEVDWDHALPAIGAQLKTAVFFKHTDSFIALMGGVAPLSGPIVFGSGTNTRGSDAYGLELSLKGEIGRTWRWGVGYRYESVDDHFNANSRTFLDFEHTTPEHVVKANLGWSDRRWEVDGYVGYQSATEGVAALPFGAGFFLTPVNAYVSLDGRVAYRMSDWAIFAVAGQNLLESPQQQTSGPEVERRVIATLSINY